MSVLLQEGDIIELVNGMKVYAKVPKHFLYSNRKGDFTLDRGEVTLGGELSYLIGRYVVYKTSHDGGGTGHGSGDVYPSGHHVFCEKIDGDTRYRVDFYQTGCFTCMIPPTAISAIGKATLKYVVEK